MDIQISSNFERQIFESVNGDDKIVKKIMNAFKNNKKHVLGIFIDLSKAFDTIDHKILLKKLV